MSAFIPELARSCIGANKQRLMSLGLLRAAWRPGDEVCVVRAVVRQRDVLLVEQATWVQRMQKALVQMNIQLIEVLSERVIQTVGGSFLRVDGRQAGADYAGDLANGLELPCD